LLAVDGKDKIAALCEDFSMERRLTVVILQGKAQIIYTYDCI
jgi:hypothetical protein